MCCNSDPTYSSVIIFVLVIALIKKQIQTRMIVQQANGRISLYFKGQYISNRLFYFTFAFKIL